MKLLRDGPPSINVVFDRQHALLIERFERVEQAIDARQSAAEIALLIHGLHEYLRHHLPTEERLMDTYGYPLREVHAMEHEKFIVRLRELEHTVSKGHIAAAAETLNRLRASLDRHMLDWDTKLGEFLVARRVA